MKDVFRRFFSLRNIVPVVTIVGAFIGTFVTNPFGLQREQSVLRVIFPEKVFEWFDVADGTKDDKTVRIVFKEKNIPPMTEQQKRETVLSKGFTDITITDSPIRGRTTFLTFRLQNHP